MSKLIQQPDSPQIDCAPPSDGRRLRSLRNRRRIVEALLQLIEAGNYAPSAEAVAEAAGVGLRSVYRHFSDMESLYREIGEALCGELAPLVTEPLAGDGWRQRLDALLERKIQLMDRAQHQFLFGRARRHDLVCAAQAQARTRAMERKALSRIWPGQLAADRELFEAVEMLLSFDSWVRLRSEQKLSVGRSRALVRRLLAELLDGRDRACAPGG